MSQEVEVSQLKTLISLLNTKGARVSELAGIKTPNYYKWAGGKPNALSDKNVEKLFSVLGVIKGKLDTNVVHRWHESDKNGENISRALLSLISKDQHHQSEIYHTRTYQNDKLKNEKFNILKLVSAENTILILCFNANAKADAFPINAKKIGFGIDKHTNDIPHAIYTKWANPKLALDFNTFKADATTHLPELHLSNLNINPQTLELPESLHSANEEMIDLKSTNAGLKAIIRSLLRALRNENSDSILTNDEARKKIFEEYYEHEYEKLTERKTLDF